MTVMEEDQWRPAGVNFYQENVVPSLEPEAYTGAEDITVRIQVPHKSLAVRACIGASHGCGRC